VASNDKEDKSALGGEAKLERVPFVLLPTSVVLVTPFVFLALSISEADLRELMGGSGAIFSPEDLLFSVSDKPVSAFDRLFNLPVCGVRGRAGLRVAMRSLAGECRSALSLRAREFRALDAALTEIGEGWGYE
jgi:hypothetical protein